MSNNKLRQIEELIILRNHSVNEKKDMFKNIETHV